MAKRRKPDWVGVPVSFSRLYADEVYDRSIDVQILRLCRKIEVNPSEPQFINTERAAGYIFSVPVEVLYWERSLSPGLRLGRQRAEEKSGASFRLRPAFGLTLY